MLRQVNTDYNEEELSRHIFDSSKIDVIGLTKGRGTLGPVARRNIKMQKRKAASSGVQRKPGSMGLRGPAKVAPSKPFMGKTGFSRRTLISLVNLGSVEVENYTSFKYHIKRGTLLKVKGSVTGPIGRIVAVRRALRK